MSHDHDHDHAHHHPIPTNFDRRFAFGMAINLIFVLIEAFYGWQANSLALLADAGHNLGDVAGLALAWAALAAGRIRADDRHTYGWQRGSILASFINAAVLLLLMGGLAVEAMQRFTVVTEVHEWPVIVVATIGIVINSATAWLFLAGSKHDLNIRGAFLHMAADALVSLGVVIGAFVIMGTGWFWLDPVISLLIAAVVVWGTWSLFRQSLHLLFDGVPKEIDLVSVRKHLLALPGVAGLHDLHVWALSTSRNGLTAHLVLAPDAAAPDQLLAQAEHLLHEEFNINHVTIQIETATYAAHCALAYTHENSACPGAMV
ncbi:cation diffusion facilitator family transporter [Halothiobacillus neapolitanus]|uniref:Cation diffusion facilitator family transporter n=1 Tax=Halothiobacillus neapolitanus (strain ATCC 23641 / DSM 15147 / CIP 104769 / NCIMB 8539 / c2) TaxID=555778 RepID=D0KZG2_HALNC|nr:cation diffusion facilitator family transporter [Halothiobacillus neapolitanus]ACX95835.1 cation diffusion facilitator family transporter [Halothiobacillus neapolitanus c2]TDN66146.1 cobalt-zinc-cadmium efflux system protein [Halothiobacillus neapolitanus]